jgi:ABC-2 type transport system permease protein
MQPFLNQTLDLFLIQLTNWRWSWRTAIIQGIVVPTIGLIAFSAFAGTDDMLALSYILTGNMVFSLLFGTTDRVATHFAYIRATGMLDYFASMPLYRVSLVLATASAFLLLALPSVLAVLLIGWLILDVPVSISPLIIVVIPLITFALSGLGAIIGTLNRPLEEIGSISSLVSIVMLLLGPVMLPPDRLHPALEAVGLFSPATYAASALRHVLLLDQPNPIALEVDILVLTGTMVGLLWWSGRRMQWRQVG